MEYIGSYILYFATFSISIFFAYMYSHNYILYSSCDHVRAKTSYICLQAFTCIGILAPLIFLYTFRYGVGVDYYNYIDDFDWYGPRNFADLPNGYTEIGYGAINIIAYRLFGSYRGLLFLNSLLTVIPAVLSIKLFNIKQFPLGLSIYLLILYPSSFNGMRQHIAVSFIMLGIVMIYSGRYFWYFFCIIVACFFHKTSIIGLMFLFFINIKRENNYLKYIGMILLIVVGILMVEPIMKLSSRLPIINFYYSKYIDTYDAYNLTHYIVHTFFRLPLAFVLLLYYKVILKKDKKNFAVIICPFIDFLFIYMSKVIRWAIRMTYFTMASIPFSVMLIGSNEQIKERDKKLIIVLIIVTFAFRFAALFGYADYDGVIPYQFSFMQ